MLLINVRKKLSEKQINVEDLKFLANGIFQGEYISKSSNVNEIFEAMSYHRLWDYWNYYPLEELVQAFAADDSNITSMMEAYRQDLESFKVTNKLIDYIDAMRLTPFERPARYDQRYYQALSIKLKTKVTEHTLVYIDNIWNKISDLYDLPPSAALLEHIYEGCVLIVWLIPSHLAPQIRSAAAPIGAEFYFKHDITKVELDGKCIYETEKERDDVHMDRTKNKTQQFILPVAEESQGNH